VSDVALPVVVFLLTCTTAGLIVVNSYAGQLRDEDTVKDAEAF
jgi:hypothetical protein